MIPFGTIHTIIRKVVSGAYANGIYVVSGTTSTPGTGNVQPVKGKELENLPENQRTKKVIRIYTEMVFVPGNTVEYDSDNYQVFQVDNYYTQPFLGHFVVYASRENYEGQS